MDKRKVIIAHQRGFLTLQECAQILGVERTHVETLLVRDKDTAEGSTALPIVVGKDALRGMPGTYEAN